MPVLNYHEFLKQNNVIYNTFVATILSAFEIGLACIFCVLSREDVRKHPNQAFSVSRC
jgi:hypothetical protein